MVWRDVNTLHKITEIGINSFGKKNPWNVIHHLQHSKFGLGVFFILFMRENVAESRASSACFTILSCGQCRKCGRGFGFYENGQQTLSSLFLR